MSPRKLIGYSLVALAFVLILLLGSGMIEPFGNYGGGRSIGGVLAAIAPSLLIPFAIFLVGIGLARGGRRS